MSERKTVVIVVAVFIALLSAMGYAFSFRKIRFHDRIYYNAGIVSLNYYRQFSGKNLVYTGIWIRGLPLYQPPLVHNSYSNPHYVPTVLYLRLIAGYESLTLSGGP